MRESNDELAHEYLTVTEVARLLRLHPGTVRRRAAAWHAQGASAPVQVYRLPGSTTSGWRLRTDDIYRLMLGE